MCIREGKQVTVHQWMFHKLKRPDKYWGWRGPCKGWGPYRNREDLRTSRFDALHPWHLYSHGTDPAIGLWLLGTDRSQWLQTVSTKLRMTDILMCSADYNKITRQGIDTWMISSSWNVYQFSVDGHFAIVVETVLHLFVSHELEGSVRHTQHSWQKSFVQASNSFETIRLD